MEQKRSKKHQKIVEFSGKQKAFIATLIVGGVIVLANVILLIAYLAHLPLNLDENFTMRIGDYGLIRTLGNRDLRLTDIHDGRCPEDENIVCSWEGQIYYIFNFDGEEVVVGSVLENDRSRKLDGDITIDFVDGDASSGIFILRKTQE